MAFYKHIDLMSRQFGQEFDELHAPGDPVPLSGVYGCHACGRSIVARRGEVFPMENHNHDAVRPVLWRLVVRSHSA